jgi:hypothetical protein
MSPDAAGSAGRWPLADAQAGPPPVASEPAPARAEHREEAVLGVRVAAAMVLVGGLVGLVWRFVAPVAQVRMDAQGGYFVDPAPEQYVAGDVWFAGLSLAAGVVAGLVTWRVLRRAPMGAVVGLAVGATTGAFVAREVGQLLGHVDGAAAARLPVGTVLGVSLQVQAGAVLAALPVASVGTWLVLDLLADARAGRAERREQPGDPSPDPNPGPSPDPGAATNVSRDGPAGPPPHPSA